MCTEINTRIAQFGCGAFSARFLALVLTCSTHAECVDRWQVW